MKLNPECIRDILLSVEDTVTANKAWTYYSDSPRGELSKYTSDEIVYHVRQCSLSDLIIGLKAYDGGDSLLVSDLSPMGHEFLANIRVATVWKKVLIKGAGASLSILAEIAKELAVKHFLG